MAEFVYFKNACRMWYPVGQYFSSDNFDYIREAASSINKVFPTGKLILVVRGHSGSILAGGIAYILKRKDRDVLISVSRKAESTHGDNLEGISSHTVSGDTHIIVVDDFVQTGETIEAILKDLTERIEDMKVLVVLLFLFYLVWAYIRYDPKLDWIEKEGETLHIILWYNKHYWSGEVERKYIILF